MSTVIDAGRERVWRALTAPEEVVRWDERTIALVDAPDRYPRIGEKVREDRHDGDRTDGQQQQRHERLDQGRSSLALRGHEPDTQTAPFHVS